MHSQLRTHIERHIQLSEKEFDYFLSIGRHRKIRKRQYLLQAGDICLYESYVIHGCLREYYIDEKGQEHILQFAVEDWWIGDMHSFLTESPSVYNIDALEDTELLQIDKSSLETLYKHVPQFERFFRLKIQNAYIQLQKRVISSMSKPAEERYIEFIEKYPHLEQRLPQHQVASFLGITPEFLSRIRKNLSANRK